MAVSKDFLDYVLDQLSTFGRVTARRMFGGIGLYKDELFFGLIDDNVVYFKADDSNRADYEARGARRFRPFRDKPLLSLSYYEVVESVLEDAEELAVWARKSRAAASAKAGKKNKSTRAARPRRRTRHQ